LGVHFKTSANNSLVWVTSLDKGKPVEGAQVQISDCLGEPVWSGRTDKQGLARVQQALPPLMWDHCLRGARSENEMGYFVSARKTDVQGRADMAFVWSTWSQGSEPWRFHVDTSGSDTPSSTIYHSVMDRTLLRAGQTV